MSLPDKPYFMGLSREETRNVTGLSAIVGLRMLGLFLVLPVLSPYALRLGGATPLLAGLAIGAYGLSQAALQLPFGILSDRVGRKRVLAGGLTLFVLGSIWAADARTAQSLVWARLLQGSGAVASVAIAMAADLTREEVRTRAMAVIGISIGLTFALGFLAGPLLAAHWGVPNLFKLMAALGGGAIAFLMLFVPEPVRHGRDVLSLRRIPRLLADRNLASLDALNFVLSAGMSAVFVVTPVLLAERMGRDQLWKVYLPMLLAGGAVMLPAMAWAERRKRLKQLLGAGIAVCAAGFALLAFGGPRGLVPGLIVYFVGFNLMEPSLPSLVTRFAPLAQRGASIGVFNMSQYLGSFVGGTAGGWLLGVGPVWAYAAGLLLCVPWAWAAALLDDPRHIEELRFPERRDAPLPSSVHRPDGIYDLSKGAEGELVVRFSRSRWAREDLRAWLAARRLIAG